MSKIKSKGGVYVQGDFANRATKKIFVDHGYHISPSITFADVVVWTGGEDISPEIYGEENVFSYSINQQRDEADLDAARLAFIGGKFLVGICRGAQLLNCVPNHGSLWQDVNMHGGGHHIIEDYVTGERYYVNSLHHQMLRLGPNAVLVAGCQLSNRRRSYGLREDTLQRDPEVVWYPKTRSLLFQGHPEFGHKGTTEYFFSLMERYYENTSVATAIPAEIKTQPSRIGGPVRLPAVINSHDGGSGSVKSGPADSGEQDDSADLACLVKAATATCGDVPGDAS